MKIHRIRLTNYRHIENAEKKFLPVGVTILEGPNESGKSCFAEALDLVLEELDSSTKQAVRAVQPIGKDLGPQVEVDIETGSYRFSLVKRFLKEKKTELHVLQPRPEALVGRDAHQRLQEILNATLDVGLWKALRIVQGESVGQVELPMQSLLTRALDQAAGGRPATERENTLYEAMRGEYERYFTPTGRERDELRRAEVGLRELERSVSELDSKEAKVREDVQKTADLGRRIIDVTGKLDGFAKTAEEWKAKAAIVTQAQGQLATLEAELEAAVQTTKNSAQAIAQRLELVQKVEKSRKDLGEVAEETKALAEKVEQARKALDDAKKFSQEAEKKAQTARDLADLRQRDNDYHHFAFDLTLLQERRKRHEKALEQAEEALRILQTNSLDKPALDKIQKAHQAVELAKARLEEGGPSMRLTALTELQGTINGKAFRLKNKENLERAVAEDLGLRVPHQFEIEVRPGTSSEGLRANLREAAEKLEALLRKHGVGNLAEAVRGHEAYEAASRRKGELDESVQVNLRDFTFDQLGDKIRELEERLAAHRRTRPEAPPLPRDRDTAKKLADETARVAKDADAELRRALRAVDARQRVWDDSREDHIKKQTRIQVLTQTALELDEQLARARSDTNDEELAKKAKADAEVESERRKKAEEARGQLVLLDPETVQTRSEAAQRTLERAREELGKLREEQAGVLAILSRHEEEGIFEIAERERTRLEHAKRELASLQRRAAAARLLFTVMSEHRMAAQQTYVRPLKERIESLGRIIFGKSFQVDLNDDLTITGCTRNSVPIPFESLSTGTKEQLSLLARLACATLVAKDGAGVPLIIDDALGYSDSSRLEAMGAVLDLAGRECQVIVMTCMPDRYRHVGNAKVENMG